MGQPVAFAAAALRAARIPSGRVPDTDEHSVVAANRASPGDPFPRKLAPITEPCAQQAAQHDRTGRGFPVADEGEPERTPECAGQVVHDHRQAVCWAIKTRNEAGRLYETRRSSTTIVSTMASCSYIQRVSQPAISAPRIGAIQNSHSCAICSPPANNAGPVLRAGLTEVLVTGIETRWISVSARPIGIPAKPAAAPFDVVPMMMNRKKNVI